MLVGSVRIWPEVGDPIGVAARDAVAPVTPDTFGLVVVASPPLEYAVSGAHLPLPLLPGAGADPVGSAR